ncbi:MAG: PIG-L family deacetylase [Clostridia bacterium]|nr:PIG-L family deacetylase [Clostridia bacterium]
MRILVIAPHADDEVIGAGGLISRYVDEGHEVYVCIVTRGTEPLFDKAFMDKLRRETLESHSLLGVKKTFFLEFPSVMLENEKRYIVNGKIFDVIKEVDPVEVYIPHIGDMQKDHQIVAEASMVALRPKYESSLKRIYAYETLSETGWNIPNVQNEFIPDVYVDISNYIDAKISAMKKYESQLSDFPAARSIQAMEALAKYRGANVNMNAAEAFMLIRETK